MDEQKNKVSMKERFKSFTVENWIILAIEFVLMVMFFYFGIYFAIELKNGVSFLGTNFKSYEIGVTIVILILALSMVFVVLYDIFKRDYVKERKDTTKKIVRDGRVITLESESQKEENEKKNSSK